MTGWCPQPAHCMCGRCAVGLSDCSVLLACCSCCPKEEDTLFPRGFACRQGSQAGADLDLPGPDQVVAGVCAVPLAVPLHCQRLKGVIVDVLLQAGPGARHWLLHLADGASVVLATCRQPHVVTLAALQGSRGCSRGRETWTGLLPGQGHAECLTWRCAADRQAASNTAAPVWAAGSPALALLLFANSILKRFPCTSSSEDIRMCLSGHELLTQDCSKHGRSTACGGALIAAARQGSTSCHSRVMPLS